MGDPDAVGTAPLGLSDRVEDPAQQLCPQGVGGDGGAPEQEGSRVAEPALELSHHSRGIRETPPPGGLAHEDGLVFSQEHHRRDVGIAAAESGDLNPALPANGCGRIGGALVDA